MKGTALHFSIHSVMGFVLLTQGKKNQLKLGCCQICPNLIMVISKQKGQDTFSEQEFEIKKKHQQVPKRLCKLIRIKSVSLLLWSRSLQTWVFSSVNGIMITSGFSQFVGFGAGMQYVPRHCLYKILSSLLGKKLKGTWTVGAVTKRALRFT